MMQEKLLDLKFRVRHRLPEFLRAARLYLNERIDPDTALKCAVALKKRDFAMDVLLDRVEANGLKGR